MKDVQWYKINLEMDDNISTIKRFETILNFIDSVKPKNIACFTKVANDGSCNVFLTEEIVKHLEPDLKKYMLAKCPPPQNKRDEYGSLLSYIFGNPNILKDS